MKRKKLSIVDKEANQESKNKNYTPRSREHEDNTRN